MKNRSITAIWNLLERHKAILLFALLILTLLTRLVSLGIEGIQEPVKDAATYDSIAWNLVQGNGFSEDTQNYHGTSWRVGPAYPFFVAGLYGIFGHSYLAIYIAQAVLSVLIGWLIYQIGSRCFGVKAGLIATLLWAVYPRGFLYSNRVLTETLFTFLLIALIAILLYAQQSPQKYWYFLLGGLLGLASLTRPMLLLFPFFILIYLLWQKWKISTLKCWILICLVMLGVIAPWIYRNYQVSGGQFIPVHTMGSVVYFSVYEAVPDQITPRAEVLDGRNKQEADSDFVEATIRVLSENPLSVLQGAGTKLGRLSGILPDSPINSSPGRLVQYIFWIILLLAALFGAIVAFRLRRGGVIFLPVIYAIAVHSIIHVDGRYREPFMPYILLLVAVFVVFLVDRFVLVSNTPGEMAFQAPMDGSDKL